MSNKRKGKRVRRRRKQQIYRRIVMLMVTVVFLLACLIAVSDSLIREPSINTVPALSGSKDDATLRKKGFYTVLVCGIDDGNGGTDTIMLASLDAENKEAHVVSIPRDTLVNEDWTVKKINSAYNRGGIDAVREQVEKIAGFPVDFYVTVDLKAFVELVDAVGGVDFDVPIDMNYDDPAQDLHIHFSAGMQHLNGKQAMGVVRFRHNNNGGGYPLQDLGRIQTQQAFLKTMADKLFSMSGVIKIPEFTRIFSAHVKSDLSLGEMLWFANRVREIGTEGITFTTLPGEPQTVYGGSYFVLDPDQCLTLLNEQFNPYKEPLNAANLDIKRIKS